MNGLTTPGTDDGLYTDDPTMMQTFTGRRFTPARITVEDVEVADIAVALGNICRYGGHVNRYMSVAEHSVRVSRRIERDGHSLPFIIAGLFHDAHEAYLGDIIQPLKRTDDYRFYRERAERCDHAIAAHIGIDPLLLTCDIVKRADEAELHREMETFAGTWGPAESTRRFMNVWQRLRAARNAVTS